MLKNENKPLNLWRCPVCLAPLELNNSYQCTNGHHFDLAREGYVNLLLPQQKRSAYPGDTKAMLRHRRDFLNKGHYQPLAEKLTDLCQFHLEGKQAYSLLDAGCGEGYYCNHITSKLNAQLAWSGGIDISKEAIRMAAKSYSNIHFAVASTARIPLADNTIDIMLRIFAPGTASEVDRCLKPGGIYITATPGPEHLFQLRSLVYDAPLRHEYQQETISGRAPIQTINLAYNIKLNNHQDIANLFSMTPYYWQADKTKQEQILSLQQLSANIDFRISIYQK